MENIMIQKKTPTRVGLVNGETIVLSYRIFN